MLLYGILIYHIKKLFFSEIKERNRKAKEEKSKKAASKPVVASTAAKSKAKK